VEGEYKVLELLDPSKFEYRLHEITMDDSVKRGWYVQIGSFNALMHGGVLKHWYANYLMKGKKHRLILSDCHPTWFKDQQRLTALGYGSIAGKVVGEPVKHTSLWEFYKYVGYDYKKRNYSALIKEFTSSPSAGGE